MSIDFEALNDPRTLYAAYQITALDQPGGWYERLIYQTLEERFRGEVYTRTVWDEKLAALRVEMDD
jgi:hypothetical protein